MHVDVDQFLFHVVQLPPIRFTQQNLFCISESIMKHQPKTKQKNGWKIGPPLI